MRKLLLDALFPKTRQAVLSAYLLHPDRWWYLSDLAQHLNLTPSSLQRELASLSEVNLLETRKDGNRIYYRANPSCPGIQDLQALLIKTAGIAEIVRSALAKFMKDINLAFIYGSMARAEAIASSDIDLMIIGDLKLADLAPSLRKAEKTLEREISSTLYSRREFVHKSREGNAFIQTVRLDKKIFLKGSDNELETLVGQR